jgi:uncharacterized membrane protein HdeD (DUF308 family)
MAVVERLAENLAETLSRNWWVLLLRGVVAILFGVLTFMQPGISLASLVLLFGAYSFADGVLGSWTAISHRKDHENWWVLLLGRLRKELEGEWALIVAGVASVAFGALLMASPGAGALAVLWLIASYAIFFGVLFVSLAFRVRGVARRIEARARA